MIERTDPSRTARADLRGGARSRRPLRARPETPRPVETARLLAELTLVLPAYNEAAGIARVVEEARARLAERCGRFEIVVVDDGSTDETPRRLAALAEAVPELRVVRQPHNLGYAAALARGFAEARFDPVLYTDADGQFDLADLDRAAPLLATGVAFVAGYRAVRADPWHRRLASAGFNLLARRLLGIRARDVDCAFKLFRRDFLRALPTTSSGFLIDAEIFARARRAGYRFAQLAVTHRPRVAGSSTVRWTAVAESARQLVALRRQLLGEERAALPAVRAHRWRALSWAGPALVALALGLFAQGARGLGEPDEGRAVDIASRMLSSGDWIVPRLDGLVYLDKPPLTYWLTASSLALLGPSELAARLPLVFAFALTAGLVAWFGAQLWGARAAPWCGAAYALSLAPFAGAAVLTPDAFLACAGTATAALFWRAIHDGDRTRFWLLAGAAAGLGLMTKGAAMLLLALPLVFAETLRHRGLGWLRARGPWLAFAVALVVGLPWYISIARELPRAAVYFVSNQITGRVLDRGYDRNPQWSKIATLYLPVLLVGGLPWSLAWWTWARAPWRRRREHGWPARPELRFLALWLLVPLAVFCAARSRLPLYLLPLFSPLALLAGGRLARSAPSWTPAGRRWRGALALLWLVALGALKVGAAERADRRDGRRLAAWITAAAPGAAKPAVWAVDADLHSLGFYGFDDVRWATTKLESYPMFTPLPGLAETLRRERPRRVLAVAPAERLPIVRRDFAQAGLSCRACPGEERLALLDCARAHRLHHHRAG